MCLMESNGKILNVFVSTTGMSVMLAMFHLT